MEQYNNYITRDTGNVSIAIEAKGREKREEDRLNELVMIATLDSLVGSIMALLYTFTYRKLADFLVGY